MATAVEKRVTSQQEACREKRVHFRQGNADHVAIIKERIVHRESVHRKYPVQRKPPPTVTSSSSSSSAASLTDGPRSNEEQNRCRRSQSLRNDRLTCLENRAVRLRRSQSMKYKQENERSSDPPKKVVSQPQRIPNGNCRRPVVERTRSARTLIMKLKEVRSVDALSKESLRDAATLQKALQIAISEQTKLERRFAALCQFALPSPEVNLPALLALTDGQTEQRMQQRRDAETRLQDKTRECEVLTQQLQDKMRQCQTLEAELERAAERSAELTAANNDARLQLDRLQEQMRDVVEKRKELEREHAEALVELRQKQEEVKRMSKSQESERQHSLDAIQVLESRLRELEKKCELENVRQEEITLEMDTLRKIQSKQKRELSASNSLVSSAISTPVVASETDLPSDACFSGAPAAITRPSSAIPSSLAALTTTSAPPSLTPLSRTISSSLANIASATTSMVSQVSASSTSSLTSSHHRTLPPLGALPDPAAAIDRIMAKIEQDNKVLAELDKTRATMGLTGRVTVESGYLSGGSFSGSPSYLTSSLRPASPLPGLSQSGPATLSSLQTSLSSSLQPAIGSLLQHRNIPAIVTTYISDGPSLLNSSLGLQTTAYFPTSDYLEIPGQGRHEIFIARYTYDPLTHSPNENPEAELPVQAGEYIISHSDIDEDGFFDGELLDGRRGLVPSNFTEKLRGDDLVEFQQMLVFGNVDSLALDGNDVLLDSDMGIIDLEDILEVDEEFLVDHNGQGGGFFSLLVPAPQRLSVERQLTKSVLISWLPPEKAPGNVDAYNVYVDGELRSTVMAGERTRALIEGVDSNRLHRISVRSVTPNQRMSVDAACTLIIGKDAPIAPTCVRATHVTSTSAIISWLPSNSNFQHAVCVNNVEVRVVKPGVFRHTITGLGPNTTYRVTVRVKNFKTMPNDDKSKLKAEQMATFIDFRTLPKGLPDPPLDVQVEAGPQDGSLLVTWLPVTINIMGVSNGTPVVGYAVYADGRKLADIDSPTGDHALIDISQLASLQFMPRTVTVRTKSRECQSHDSQVAPIPMDVAKACRTRLKSPDSPASLSDYGDYTSFVDLARSDSDGSLNEFIMICGEPQDLEPLELELYSMGHSFHEKELGDCLRDDEFSERSELSDIIEETEDTDHDHKSRMGRLQDDTGKGRMDDHHVRRPRDNRPPPPRDRGGPPTRGNMRAPPPQQPPMAPNAPHGPHHPGTLAGSTSARGEHGRSKRHDNMGQTIIEPDENLSDKEVYPNSHMPISSVDEEWDRSGRRRACSHDAQHRGYPADRHQPYPDRYQRSRPGPPRGSEPYPPTDDYNGDYPRRRELREERGGNRPPPPGPHGRGPPPGGPPPQGPAPNAPAHAVRQPPRMFVALFDYDPKTMSPNPDAAQEELPFREGQIIKIFGDKDADGFYWGEVNNRQGFVPCNMVSQVQGGEEEGRRGAPPPRRRDRWAESQPGQSVRKMVALYDYDPQELSPNVDAEQVELSFNTGDIVYVYGDMDEDGFYMGEMNGARGLVPSNFLEEAPPDYVVRRRGNQVFMTEPRDGDKFNQTRSGGQRW